MKILVSACLLGHNCKYNGKNNRHDELINLLANHEVIPICPEQLGGLTTPRIPSEILAERVINKALDDVTLEFTVGALKSLEVAESNAINLAILKEKSPSCGVNYIYDGTFTGTIIVGNGVTARILKENGYNVLNEDEGCLFLKNIKY